MRFGSIILIPKFTVVNRYFMPMMRSVSTNLVIAPPFEPWTTFSKLSECKKKAVILQTINQFKELTGMREKMALCAKILECHEFWQKTGDCDEFGTPLIGNEAADMVFRLLVQMRNDINNVLDDDNGVRGRDSELLSIDAKLKRLVKARIKESDLRLMLINKESPASLVDFIIDREAVHPFASVSEVMARSDPDRGRYIFVLLHCLLSPLEPVAFVNVALTNRIATGIRSLLGPAIQGSKPYIHDTSSLKANTAMFYSISNSCPALAGTDMAKILLKRAMQELQQNSPNVKVFCTLSPIPGFRSWFNSQTLSSSIPSLPSSIPSLSSSIPSSSLPPPSSNESILDLCKRYLLLAKDSKGFALDPVAHFHFRNGASFHGINFDSASGIPRFEKESFGMMVNYLYPTDVTAIERNSRMYLEFKEITISQKEQSKL